MGLGGMGTAFPHPIWIWYPMISASGQNGSGDTNQHHMLGGTRSLLCSTGRLAQLSMVLSLQTECTWFNTSFLLTHECVFLQGVDVWLTAATPESILPFISSRQRSPSSRFMKATKPQFFFLCLSSSVLGHITLTLARGPNLPNV